MIKIGVRKNLVYPFMIIISSFLRKINSIIISKFEIKVSLLLTIIMFVAEFIGGLIVFKYNLKYISRKKNNNEVKSRGIQLIQNSLSSDLNHIDNCFTIYFLIFAIALFDFIEFMIVTLYLGGKIIYKNETHKTLDLRLTSLMSISSALYSYFLLQNPLYKHHIFSLVIIFISLIIIIISDFVYNYIPNNSNIYDFIYVLILIFVSHFFNSTKDIIEKYLLQYDFINPFQMLMIEGIFGLIISGLYCPIENPFNKDHFKNIDNVYCLILFIICLVFYFLFCAIRNIYRVETNRLFSPMVRTLTDTFYIPVFIIYDYCNNDINIYHFILNLIISIIIVFGGCIYNELFVIFCCNLEYNTYIEISRRSKKYENLFEYKLDENNDHLDNDDDSH